MDSGGLIGESKIDILNSILPEFKPKTFFLKGNKNQPNPIEGIADMDRVQEVLAHIAKNKMNFPLICKPNVGERGNSVEKIGNEEDLKMYLAENHGDMIVQEFITYPIELGVMYVRLPNEARGKVTSITMKKFLTVVGNGKSSIYDLLQANERARFQIERLQKKMPNKLKMIPQSGEEVMIEPIGNHCRGTEFINRNDLVKGEIHTVFDRISSTITGFYYGRFDLKIAHFDALYTGKNIKIMELNGVASEPAHIYDANYSLWQAYKDILYHWGLIWEIYVQNTKAKI
jgi:ATP-grasp domain